MASAAFRVGSRQVKPILSLDQVIAHRRVLNLYKLWYREIPDIIKYYQLPKSTAQCYKKLRQEFMQHANITDIRVIDMLVIKGHMTLKETIEQWTSKGRLMYYWRDTVEKKPTDFLSKFLSGQD